MAEALDGRHQSDFGARAAVVSTFGARFRFRFRALTARHTPTIPGEAYAGGARARGAHTDALAH